MQGTLNRIQRGFSKSATVYDRYSGMHREIADKLFVQVVKEPKPTALLDVGCGTGYLAVKIKEHFFQSNIIGLDFAPGMLDVARTKNNNVDWVLGEDNNLPFAGGSFDMVISNLAYQWAIDLTRSFAQARRVLIPQGVLVGTLFGFDTCQELLQSLDEANNRGMQFTRLPDETQVREALILSGFENPKVESENIKKEFSDMRELMGWLKSIGANHLSKKEFLGPEALLKAASIYREKFSHGQGVMATFEVIRFYAKK